MTKTKALQKLYTKLTGLPARNTLAKVLSDLADNYSGGGGGGLFIVNADIEFNEFPEVTHMDKTYAEIDEAFLNGMDIVIDAHSGDEEVAVLRLPMKEYVPEAKIGTLTHKRIYKFQYFAIAHIDMSSSTSDVMSFEINVEENYVSCVAGQHLISNAN